MCMSDDINKLTKYLKAIASLKTQIQQVIEKLDFANGQYTVTNNQLADATTIEEEMSLIKDCHDIRNEAANRALSDFASVSKNVGDLTKEAEHDFPNSPITTELININAPLKSGNDSLNRFHEEREIKFAAAERTPDTEGKLYQLDLADKKSKQMMDLVGNTLNYTNHQLDVCSNKIQTVANKEASRNVLVGKTSHDLSNSLILQIRDIETQRLLYAKHAFLMDGPVRIETSSGKVFKGNEPGIDHGTGDYIISADLDFSDEWICNGVKFGNKYEVVKIPAIKFNDIDNKATCLKELYRYTDMVKEELISQDGLLIAYEKDPSTRLQLIAVEQNPNSIYDINEPSREAEELYRIKQEEEEYHKDCTEDRESIGYIILAGAIGLSIVNREERDDDSIMERTLI